MFDMLSIGIPITDKKIIDIYLVVCAFKSVCLLCYCVTG